jgi:hypothetical protein
VLAAEERGHGLEQGTLGWLERPQQRHALACALICALFPLVGLTSFFWGLRPRR